MALASQSVRVSGSARAFGRGSVKSRTSRRRRRNLRLMGAALFALMAFGVWAIWPDGPKGSPDELTAAPVAEAEREKNLQEASPARAEPQRLASNTKNTPAPTRPLPGSTSGGSTSGVNGTNGQSAARDRSLAETKTPVMQMGRRPGNTATTPATVHTPTAAPTSAPASRNAEHPSQRGARVARLISRAQDSLSRNRPVQAREAFNLALHDAGATESDRVMIRDEMARINDILVFSSKVAPGDPFTRVYRIQSGDSLSKLPKRENLEVSWGFLKRINNLKDANKIRVNQSIKLFAGPFHAVISKSQFRMDLYAGTSPEVGLAGGSSEMLPIYIRSFNVGLGEFGSTPTGVWVVPPASKAVNPAWVNPRTNERFASDNPNNPIGERWIGLEGADDNTRMLAGYGIHGTIDPDSIGTEASMGCVRLADEDIKLVYEMLVEGVSTVMVVD